MATEPGPRAAARWLVLGAYVAAVYAFLPYGPALGRALAGSAPGAWLLGPGIIVLAVAGALGLLLMLRRNGAPGWAYGTLAGASVTYVVAFSWLRSRHLERTHLPEYGIAAWLAWRAVHPLVPGALAGYGAAALLGAAIGYCDELLQLVVPGRVYDPRDIAMNALGAMLGVVVLAAVRARRES